MLHLRWDLQSATSQDPSVLTSHLQVRALPEWVAVQEVGKDGVEDLIRHDCLSKENCVLQYQSGSLIQSSSLLTIPVGLFKVGNINFVWWIS